MLAARITHVYDLGSKGPRAQRGAVAGITSASYASEPIRSFAAEYARALASLVGDDSAAPQTDALARAASAVIDARHQLESACPTKTSPACAKVKAVVEESADTESTDATALAALVARMKTIRLADPALAKPFAALMDAEAALGSAAQGIRVAALDPRVASTMESADRRFEALCGPAPWR
ncbi:MAG: hypothetical protein JWM82_4536 [Myxococcales bacterium]|nr:hypothetical protein [Myxococcales bacterium]